MTVKAIVKCSFNHFQLKRRPVDVGRVIREDSTPIRIGG